MNLFRIFLRACGAAAVASMVGCVSIKAPAPAAHPETVLVARATGAAPMKAGQFALAAGKPADMDTTLGGLRGSSMQPASGKFSQDLRDALVADLQAAGLYDEKSDIVVDAWLTDSRVDAAIGTGTGRLAARFKVTRAGRVAYDKELSADASWDSSFIGSIAIPTAIQRYGALNQALVRKLFSDDDFRKAVAR